MGNEYINDKGKVLDKLKKDLKENAVSLPDEYKNANPQVLKILTHLTGKLNIKNADDRKEVKLNKAIYLSQEFKELWGRIKHKTTYRVDFNAKELIDECAKEMRDNLIVGKTKFIYRRDLTGITRGGVVSNEVREAVHVYGARDYVLPDIVSYLQNETNLTRRAIVDILIKSNRLEDFKNNPQKFIDETIQIIRRTMRRFIVDGIKYHKIGDDYYWAQELFEDKELYGYLSKNMIEAKKSVYTHIVYDSDVESQFAEAFERSDDVKVYAKLPTWFKIDTPLGSYNPDWAVLIERNGEEKLYFVVESKGSLFTDALRPIEKAKIDCGREHFKALDADVNFMVANDFDALTDSIS